MRWELGRLVVLLLSGLAFAGGCTRHKTARRPVQMVAMPPSEPPHAWSTVPVGGAASFEADHLVSCEAEPPGLVRAYATEDALVVLGEAAGRTTLRLRLASGDEFFLDMDVTNDPIAYRVLTLGEQLAIPLEGVKEVLPVSACVKTTKNADATQLFVRGDTPCTVLVGLTMSDGTTKTTEIVVVGGERLL